MTAQMSDRFFHQGEWYDLAGVNGKGLFEPSDYGMEPEVTCTACWRGYIAGYELRDAQLLLKILLINAARTSSDETEEGKPPAEFSFRFSPNLEIIRPRDAHAAPPPPLGKVQQPRENEGMFRYAYEDVDLPLKFTGGILIAKDFISDLYVHMGFHPAWKYKCVHELEFEDGRLTRQTDVSERLAQARQKLREDPSIMRGFGQDWIEKCFSRDYQL